MGLMFTLHGLQGLPPGCVHWLLSGSEGPLAQKWKTSHDFHSPPCSSPESENIETHLQELHPGVCLESGRTEGHESRSIDSWDFQSLLLPTGRWTAGVCKHWEQQAERLVPSALPKPVQNTALFASPALWCTQRSPWGLDFCCPWVYKLRGELRSKWESAWPTDWKAPCSQKYKKTGNFYSESNQEAGNWTFCKRLQLIYLSSVWDQVQFPEHMGSERCWESSTVPWTHDKCFPIEPHSQMTAEKYLNVPTKLSCVNIVRQWSKLPTKSSLPLTL
jgi:hypothetical protein